MKVHSAEASLTAEQHHLYEAARSASENAYAPYSNFRVGAALKTTRGREFMGCNVENASYGLTCCAERSAVFAAVAAEGPNMRIEAIAVYADSPNGSPCGACRQVLYEFGPHARVTFRADGELRSYQVADLLPASFELKL